MEKYEEVLEEVRGPRVSRSRGPKDQDISNSHSNTSLTLKKVHLVLFDLPPSNKKIKMNPVVQKLSSHFRGIEEVLFNNNELRFLLIL